MDEFLQRGLQPFHILFPNKELLLSFTDPQTDQRNLKRPPTYLQIRAPLYFDSPTILIPANRPSRLCFTHGGSVERIISHRVARGAGKAFFWVNEHVQDGWWNLSSFLFIICQIIRNKPTLCDRGGKRAKSGRDVKAGQKTTAKSLVEALRLGPTGKARTDAGFHAGAEV